MPQYRCRDISQSLSLALVRCPPTLASLAFRVTESNACSLVRPVNCAERSACEGGVTVLSALVESEACAAAYLGGVHQSVSAVLVTLQNRGPLHAKSGGHRQVLFTTVWDT